MYSQNAAPHVRPFLNFFLKESILMYQKWKTDNIWIKEVKGAQLFNFPLIDLIDLVGSEVGCAVLLVPEL